MLKNKKKGLILAIFGIVSLVLITVGVTYAFFNYAKEGTTDNTITTGTITFIYEETDKQGTGISIEDAYPISDSVGKKLSSSNEVFNFKIKSETTGTEIPYTVTARKDNTSTLSEEAVRIYLTEVVGESEIELLLDNYSNLEQTSITVPENTTEKVIHTDKVPAGSSNYEKNYRLRMWIDSETDFSDGSMNDKTFKITVSVYANAKVVTEDEVNYQSSTKINTLSINETELTKAEGQDYDYETTLPQGTTSTRISVETENPNAIVEIEKIDSLAYTNNIKRLSIQKTLELSKGDNYFNIKVTSENKQITSEYKTKIVVEKDSDNTLKSLSLTNCTLSPTFSSNTTSYSCTVENNISSTIISATASSSLASIKGTGSKSLNVGTNNITITVTSENGDDKIYTINVTRKNSNYMDSSVALAIGTQVTAKDGSKWHVLENSSSGNQYVTLLSDYNLNTDGTYNTTCGFNINSTYICSARAFDPNNTNTYSETDSNNIGYFIKNTYAPKVTAALPGTTTVTIPTAYQIASADGKTFNSSGSNPLTSSWLLTTYYWTKTSNITGGVHQVYNKSIGGSSASISSLHGARPVITTLKSNLIL